MLGSGTVLLTAGIIFSAQEFFRFQKDVNAHFNAMMEVTIANITPALEFKDKRTAFGLTDAFKYYPSIVNATVYDEKGDLFAYYLKENVGHLHGLRYLQQLGKGAFSSVPYRRLQEIISGNTRIGYLYVESDASVFIARLYTLFTGIFVVFLASLGIAFLISTRLQKLVSAPILDLHQSVQALASLNFSQKVSFSSDDELGELADTFNNVLTALEKTTVSRDFFTNVMTSMNEGLLVLNLDGIITLANYALLQLLGYTEQELLGQSLGIVFSKGENAAQSVLSDISTHQQVQIYDLPYLAKTGTEIPVSFSGSILTGSVGQRVGYVAIATDIRVLKTALEKEKAALEAMADAEKKRLEAVKKAYGELEAAKNFLAEKTEELSRSNRDLEQFAYVASHDLQEPLRMVASYVELLERRYKNKLDKDANEFIAYAVDGANRMKGLIQDLLSYSRVGTQAKEFTPVNCSELFELVLSDLKLLIQETGVSVTCDESPLPTVVADALQLAQVLENLVRNAIKFRGEHNPGVRLSVKAEGRYWIFSVKDNGIGIKPAYFERIFVIFQRLHSKEKYPGTGIGLAVCKRIVERHRGKIWVESEEGKGSTFYFSIPIAGGSNGRSTPTYTKGS